MFLSQCRVIKIGNWPVNRDNHDFWYFAEILLVRLRQLESMIYTDFSLYLGHARAHDNDFSGNNAGPVTG